MTDVDSEIVEDTNNTPLADVTDDLSAWTFIEIVPLDRTAHDDHKPEVVPPLFVLKPEVVQDVKQEPADDYNTEDLCFTIQVRSLYPYDDCNIEDLCFTIQVRSEIHMYSSTSVIGF